MRSVANILILTAFFGAVHASAFSLMPDPGKNVSSKDSVSIWVENPLPDIRMSPEEKRSIDITDVFATDPDTLAVYFDPFPVSGNNSLVTGNLTQNPTTGRIFLGLESKTTYGSTYVIIKAETENSSAADTLNVKVDDPALEWFEWGSSYSFAPQNCLGSGSGEWKAAIDIDLGSKNYRISEIEFGYALPGTVSWEIVQFGTVPGDTAITGLSGTVPAAGGKASYLDEGFGAEITGPIAVVFTSDSNFMSMDPSGDSKRTWIWSEETDWTRPELISHDYRGAWYIRLSALDVTTGIEEVFSNEKTPSMIKNYPNPFNSQTVISWSMEKAALASVDIYNSGGQFVKNIASGAMKAGEHSAVFEAEGLETGIYFCSIRKDGKTVGVSKMLYLK